MSGIEFNKIIASVIIALILFVVLGIIGNLLINPDREMVETAYKIEIEESQSAKSSSNDSLSTEIESINSFLINASLENGQKISKKCSTCHNYSKDSKSKVGPNLWNIINKPKGEIQGFAYSKALIDHGGKWTYEELNGFIYNPKKYIPGTKMNFAGLKNAQDRADLIYWLREHSDSPAPLP